MSIKWSIVGIITCCIFIVFSPLYVGLETDSLDDSTLAKTLNTSRSLSPVYVSGIIITIPTITQLVLDIKFGVRSIDLIERAIIISSVLFQSFLYLVLQRTAFLPYVYLDIHSISTLLKLSACASVGNKLFPRCFPLVPSLCLLLLYAFWMTLKGLVENKNPPAWAVASVIPCFYTSVVIYSGTILIWIFVLSKKMYNTSVTTSLSGIVFEEL
jgi:hypothetical protein